MLYYPGRVVARTYAEAVVEIIAKLKKDGYTPVGDIKPRPANVQPWPDRLWWEFYQKCEVLKQ